jgi:hypothetical protein
LALGSLFSDAEIVPKLTREMTSPNKTERKSLDDILRDQGRRLTQRVLYPCRFKKTSMRKLKRRLQGGEFDNLPEKGKPLDLGACFATPEHLRMGYSHPEECRYYS